LSHAVVKYDVRLLGVFVTCFALSFSINKALLCCYVIGKLEIIRKTPVDAIYSGKFALIRNIDGHLFEKSPLLTFARERRKKKILAFLFFPFSFFSQIRGVKKKPLAME
jgi:hypothetical protein